MKVFYIVSSLGTLYLMYVKFKATYDRIHDTFRVEFLIIPAVLLAVFVNHEFEVLEVKKKQNLNQFLKIIIKNFKFKDSMDIFDLFRIGSNFTPTVYGEQNRRSRINYKSLFVCIGRISCSLYIQLDLSLLHRRFL